MSQHGVTELSTEHLQGLYWMMVRIRLFEEQVADLVQSKELRTPCHLCIGQEAVAAGVCAALEPADYIFGAHRSHGHYLAKGGDLRTLMAEIFCKSTGCSSGRGGSMHLCAPEVGLLGTVPIVAGTIPVAVGAALASQLRRDGRVSVTFFGDGATEEGHFHESLNLAGVRKLPVLFLCENNLYSSHMGLLERRVSDNITASGAAHGVPAEQVDGNDIQAVVQAVRNAVTRARNGGGPTLLECRTFRWRGHVGASWDEDVGVKRKDELKEWLGRDPIGRCATLLKKRGIADTVLDDLQTAVRAEIQESLEFARTSPYEDTSRLLEHVYAA